ncbi:MAG: hypothetical protein IIC64_16335, partial [SAR324 cluster bacterium]|nr:hypothetical protein [SAR324 cluster bacterium]
PASSKTGHIEEPKYPLALVANATGVRVACHDVRRSFIDVAEAAEVGHYAFKHLCNHQIGERDVTEAHYLKVTPTRLRDPAQKVCNLLKIRCGIDGSTGKNVVKIDA